MFQKIDDDNLPAVDQEYDPSSSPIESQHDVALNSIWAHFSEFCERAIDNDVYSRRVYDSGENSPMNTITNAARLPIFVELAKDVVLVDEVNLLQSTPPVPMPVPTASSVIRPRLFKDALLSSGCNGLQYPDSPVSVCDRGLWFG